MNTESGSTRIESPTSKSPALSQVQSVEVCERSSAGSSRSRKKVTSAATKETSTESVAR
jgi:hypothetical protein